MDLLTQATLGAAIGEAAWGRKLGNWGTAWGAGFGLLPDLDVLARSFFDPVQQFLVHRSLTHSLLFIAVVSPLVAWILYKGYRQKISYKRWMATILAIFSTHVLLDCLNNYGTLLFFPFSMYPVNLNTVFVIDPLYTLPLLTGVLVSLFLQRKSGTRRLINSIGLGISFLYLIWAVFAKIYATEQFRDALDHNQIEYNRLMTTPTPFNTFLWSGFAEKNDTLHVGLYSLWDSDDRISFKTIPKNSHLLRYTSNELPMQRALWFSRGYYTVEREKDQLYFYDLRFGRSDLWMSDDGDYIWAYRFDLQNNGKDIADFKRNDPGFKLSDGFWIRYLQRIQGE